MVHYLKVLVAHILFRPRGMNMGANSTVRLPRYILNPRQIRIGRNTHILRHCRLEACSSHSAGPLDGRINIGDDVYVGAHCMFTAMLQIDIADGCVFSDFVYVSDVAHGLKPDAGPIMKQPLESKGRVNIGRNCFIGLGSSILPGVTLGAHCIVGTRSVVTRSFPAYSLLVGNPARCVKTYDHASATWVSSAGNP
jgi:acetyltransferase-like isoleucine patch superfamily enzyme